MIIGTLENCEKYSAMGAGIEKAFEWLKKTDITKMEDGRYDIDGDNVFVWIQRYTTRVNDDCWFEGHLKYIDVHYIAEGVEYFCYSPISRAGEKISEYDTVEDDFLYTKEPETFYLMKEGDICIVWPEDVHMPQRRALFPSEVVKACIKVAL